MKHLLSAVVLFFMATLSASAYADIKVYFSPNGGCQDAVIAEINKAQKSIDIAMFSITSREIAQALIKAQERGVKIKIVLDKSQIKERFSKSRYLMMKGIDVKFHLGPGLMHDKFALFDRQVLITGSFNWTASAEKKNAENLMVITDAGIVQKFLKEFKLLDKQSGHLDS